MIKQECIGIPDMILLLMIFCFKKIKIKAEIVLSPGGAYFLNRHSKFPYRHSILVIHQQAATARLPLVIKIESLRRCAKQHFHYFYLSSSMIVAYAIFECLFC